MYVFTFFVKYYTYISTYDSFPFQLSLSIVFMPISVQPKFLKIKSFENQLRLNISKIKTHDSELRGQEEAQQCDH